ncbi:hotdog fold thioesterase [Actinokineospora inagensis]|uniref:hotdog fold thioesterase n=1 Tax=Actinokineospora inagensis TaxID=103730 RepID=UPI000412436E|nr:hotdog fold thioesterase [Actinokineospora inagensis]
MTVGAALTPWGDAAAGLPGMAPVELEPVRGYARSRFGPLVFDIARRCLSATVDGPRTGIVLATLFGDTVTADEATRGLANGGTPNPVFFFQSANSSILGHISRRYGITGPMVCVSGIADLAVEALRSAQLLLDTDAADTVLLIGADLAPNARATAIASTLGLPGVPHGDVAAGLLLQRGSSVVDVAPFDTVTGPLGWLEGLAAAVDAVDEEHDGLLTDRLGIRIVERRPDRVVGTMPVAGNRQDAGFLAGGATAAFAETLGSVAACLLADQILGQELSVTHHRVATGGRVTGVCVPLFTGIDVATFEIAVLDRPGRRIATARLTCRLRRTDRRSTK